MKHKNISNNNGFSGFTLTEMAIVFVVIAFILLAVLKGTELLHKADIDSVIVDFQRYKTASYNFRNKYHYLPGDIPNPTQYMSDAVCVDDTDNDCAGNGDGQVLRDSGEDKDEGIRAWQHLALTNMIKGTYTGERADDPDSGIVLGLNDGTDVIPASRLEHKLGGMGGYWFTYHEPVTDFSGNYIALGKDPSDTLTDTALDAIISPQNAAAIDRKVDDGKAESGLLLGVDGDDVAAESCVTTNEYDADNTTQNCVLWFKVD